MDKGILSDKLTRILRLRTPPVSVSLFKSVKQIPLGVDIPKSGFTFCQLAALARLNGGVQAGTKDSIGCSHATSVLGMTDFPEDIKSGKRLRASRTDEGAVKFVATLPKIKTGTYEAVMTSPLQKAQVDPDVVIVTGTPAQIMSMLNAITWISGERISFSSTGHAAVCGEGVAAPLLARKPQIGIPCIGARMYGLYQDDEMLIGIPGGQLDDIVKSLEEIGRAGMALPVPGWLAPPQGLR
ncbi:MAG: DUF169 domain-containing protein [Promethearchaeati archaeon SRVP18_Atabeyarchaeia-1]